MLLEGGLPLLFFIWNSFHHLCCFKLASLISLLVRTKYKLVVFARDLPSFKFCLNQSVLLYLKLICNNFFFFPHLYISFSFRHSSDYKTQSRHLDSLCVNTTGDRFMNHLVSDFHWQICSQAIGCKGFSSL